jgi:hypothetical protein
VLYPKSSPVVK